MIEIPVLWHTNETRQLEEQGMPIDPSLYRIKTITFLSIDAIAPSLDWADKKQRTEIYSSGRLFTTNIPVEEVKQLIIKANCFNFTLS